MTVPSGTAVTDVPVSWAAGTGGVAPQGYYVTRHSGETSSAACGTSPTTILAASSCLDSAVPDGEYSYVVTAVFRSWTAPSAPSDVVTVVNPHHLAVTSQPSDSTAGETISPPITITL